MSNLPNLSVIVKFFYPVAAGIETNIMETYSVLAKKNWPVTIFTSTNTLTEINTLAPSEELRGLHVKRQPWHWWGFDPGITWQSRGLVCLHNFNVFPHVWIMLWTLWLKLTGKKQFQLVLTPHGGFTPEWSIFPWYQLIPKWLYHRTLGVLLINTSVDGVRAVSEWEKRTMQSYGLARHKISVISNGIENQAFTNVDEEVSASFKKKIAGFGRYLIQIGRIHQIKNLETTIAALASLPTDVKFVIAGPVGEPEYKARLEQQIIDLGLQDRVIFFGVVRGAEKYYLIKNAQLMVHMAIWESYCNVVHEGMSQGLVCVVADNTALPLLIKNDINGYCLPSRDVGALADKLNFVLTNKKSRLIRKIEQTNRQAVKEHSWQSVAERLHTFYSTLAHVKTN